MALCLWPETAEAALAQLLEQLLEPVAQGLLVLVQIAQLLLLALALALLLALAVAPRVLALLEGLVAQLLLLADHVAEFVERRHHVVVALVALCAGPRHLQVFEHRLHFIEQLARGVLVAGARQLLQPVEHALEILLAERAGIAVERTRQLLRILAHLLGQRLQELVHRGAQIVHQLLEFFVAGAAFERLAQRVLRLRASACSAWLTLPSSICSAMSHMRATTSRSCVVGLGVGEVVIDRAQAEIDARPPA